LPQPLSAARRSSPDAYHYWATPLEGKLCAIQDIALVGGGNSAGQAAVYLASQSAKVWMLLRGSDLGASMSRYLKGFVLTGEDAGHDRHPLETNRRGVFAVGDVRSKSIKRVAAAVGEGAQVVAALHSYLA
jgi:thioredoxin reductase